MKAINWPFLALAVCAMAACDSQTLMSNNGSSTVTPQTDQCPDASGTGTGVEGGTHRLQLTLEGLPSAVTCDTRVRVTVFGFDRMVADVAATPLLEVADLVPADGIMTLHFDDADFQGIAFQAGVQDTLGYYLDVGVDLDGDGTVCGNELSQDFDASPMAFYRYADTDIAATVALKTDGEPCS